MIERFGRIVGLKLFRFRNRQVELWFCPKGERIPLHFHEAIDSHLVFLFGRMFWTSDGRSKELSWRNFLFNWIIPANVAHGAVVTGLCGVFMNIEKWTAEPTSAAKDIKLVL